MSDPGTNADAAAATGAVLALRAPAEQSEGGELRVLRWLRAVGEACTEHEPLVEIETDKVTVEVAAPASGLLSAILAPDGAQVPPGAILGYVLPAQTVQPAASSGAAGAQGACASAAGRAAVEPASAAARAHPPGPTDSTAPGSGPARGHAALAPAVRRLLAERGLSPAEVTGSGEGGRITVRDVLAAKPAGRAEAPRSQADRGGAAAAHGSAAEEGVAAPTADERGPAQLITHSAVRRRIAAHLAASVAEAPHVTTVFEANLERVLAHRARLRPQLEAQGVGLTLTAYFIQAAVTALREVPEANASWTEEGVLQFGQVHVGVATAVEGMGLLVPVLRHADRLDLEQTARALEALTARARGGTLPPGALRGSTFCVSNHGVSGSLLAAPIILPRNQAAILGVGRLEQRAVVREAAGGPVIVAEPRCYVTLTIDHRVMDGDRANRCLRTLVGALESWS